MTAAPSDLHAYLAARREDVERGLHAVLDGLAAPSVIAAPVRYALLGPGKRLRPCLTLAVAECAGAAGDLDPATARALALPGACAVEMIHTYSLVHDDLPAMDDDDLRRGRPTTHVVYGEGMGILAGDALSTEAFLVLARWTASTAPAESAPAGRRLQAIATLAEAAGIAGMVGGQAIDLAAAGRQAAFDAAALEDMHLRKTGALIRAACRVGALLVGAAPTTVAAVDAYAREVGLAFQIVDDVLDVEGSNAALGKTAGKDAAAGKPTFPAFYGIDGSRARAAACVARAHDALRDVPHSERLRAIAAWSLTREK
ncbi:MAG: polyprenyl synthetase family protein [Acidobacteria bacterium]|nr:polyprenyl synthetase family protein [Acidobacteriota bacterium]